MKYVFVYVHSLMYIKCMFQVFKATLIENINEICICLRALTLRQKLFNHKLKLLVSITISINI